MQRLHHTMMLAVGVLCAACDQPGSPKVANLAPDAVAQVGELPITQDMLRLFAVADESLLRGLVSDALLAQEVTSVDTQRRSVIERAVLGRAVIERLRDQSLLEHPATQDERARVIAEHWVRLDRPRAVRTVVFRVPVPDLADDAPYRELAEKLRAAALGSLNLETALQRTSAVETGLVVERVRMPPVAADGRVIPQNAMDHGMTQVDPQYAQQACALQAPAELSPVFALREAYQFVFSTEVIEGVSPTGAQQRREVELRVGEQRAQPTLAQIQAAGKKSLKWSEKDVPALLKLVWPE